MDIVRYVHAADLHLDTPFQGLSRELVREGQLSRLMQDATFTALDRLFRLCEEERPDFLVLAGDIYNQEQYSVRAQLALRDGCVRLQVSGIRVFVAHGNHDPLSSRLSAVDWPANVTIFGPEPEHHLLEKNGLPLAVVHGISHARDKESRNLARLFRRDAGQNCFQLGVLHCTLDNLAKSDRYAPCSLEDLRQSGLDAWALGHIHQRTLWEEMPFLAYSGNTQGLHIRETGPRGCLLVTARAQDDGWRCSAQFHALAPVQWAQLTLDVDGTERLDEVDKRLGSLLETTAGGLDPACEALLVRVVLTGRTPLDSELRDPATLTDLQERMVYLASASPRVWVKDLLPETRPLADHDEYLRREDLLGETLRLAQRLRQEPQRLREVGHAALTPLFGHNRLRHVLSQPDEAETLRLLEEAERLCMDLLEER